MNQPTDRNKWFRERVGKTVYRNDNGCPCAVCQDIKENGLEIADALHADCIYDSESEYQWKGIH